MNAINTITKEQEYFSMGAICDMCCNDLDLSVNHYFQRFLNWGLWGLVQLKMDAANCIKPVILPVSDVLTVTVPADAIDVTMVALLHGQYIKELSRADNLSKLDRTVANFNPSFRLPPGWLPNGADFQAFGGFQFGDHGGRALFMTGGGLPQRGHYTIVQRDNCKEILLDAGVTDCTNEVYVEYVGIGINACNEDTIVGPYLADYVRLYVHHQFAKYGRGKDKSEAEITRTGRELWNAEMIAKARTKAITPTDLLTISRRNYRLTNKA